MRKCSLIIFILFAGLVYADHVEPELVIEAIIDDLYMQQEGLMSRAKFDAYIKPFIKEAQESLPSMHHAIHNFYTKSCNYYIYCFLKYYPASFRCFINPNPYNQQKTFRLRMNLTEAIEWVNRDFGTKDFDVTQEFQATHDLLEKANTAYYQNLSWLQKGMLSYSIKKSDILMKTYGI